MNIRKMMGPRYTKVVDNLPNTVPFVSPETDERNRGRQFLVRLGANENVFGPSPKAIVAMQAADAELWKYGDELSHDLRLTIAKHYEIGYDNIIVGEGIDGLLGYLVRLFVEPGDVVVTSAGAYPTFNYHVNGYGGEVVAVPYNGFYEDPVALVTKAAEVDAKLIYLANPDNPMGTVRDGAVIQAAIDAVPDGSLLVLDEAYIEFAPEGSAPQFDTNDPRVIRMRTFSKAYGLAGIRVGYGIGHSDLIGNFHKVRNHFGMHRSGQIGALAALQDQEYLAKTVANVTAARDQISAIAAKNGLKAMNCATNFVTIDSGGDSAFAKLLLNEMLSRDVFIRMPFHPTQNHCIRVSAGTAHDLKLFEAALSESLAAIR